MPVPTQTSNALKSAQLLQCFQAGVVAGEVSFAIPMGRFREFSVQTIGAGGVEVQASLEPENPTNWVKLFDVAGNSLVGWEGTFTWIRLVHDGTTNSSTVWLRRSDTETETW